ncbi:hypothetical protein [Dubosiella newyorkensis]|uniref:hypothetical protein n=1 Tax=Dubosiella newyorkensis TaxID=1862672 RepID=UPI002584F5AF|nr:hypothetical protein [Dubosiella newyorkensis]
MEQKKKKKMIALIIAGVVLLGGAGVGTVIWANNSNKDDRTVETKQADLFKGVKGLELDKLYMEVKTKGTDFLKDITYDKEVVKEVLVDTSNVNYDKEGTYEIVYTIVPVDSKLDSVEKTVQIEVVSPEKAEELKKEGHDVITNETVNEDKKQEEAEKKEEESKGEEQNPSVENPSNESTGNAASGSNSGTSSTGNATGNNAVSKPSTGSNNQGTQKPSTPSHTHNWVQQYTTVHHPEKGHNEQYVVKEAWTESVPIYEEVALTICNTCGADITGKVNPHIEAHMLNGENGSYRTEWKTIQTGTNTINHPAEYGTRYVVDQAAYDEQVPAGFKCSCGAIK